MNEKSFSLVSMSSLRALMCTLFVFLCAWLFPRQAMAASYVDEAYNYQVMLSGANTIRIKVPVYNEKADDHWVCNGNLKVQVADDKGNFGSEQTLFWWREDESSKGHDNDESTLWCKFRTYVGGSFDVTQGNSSNHFTLTQGAGELRRLVYENSDGRTYEIIVEWRLPYDLLGKTLKFSWDVKCDYTNGIAWSTEYSVTGLSSTTITVPTAQDVVVPQATLATMSFSESGKLEIPWFIASNDLTAVRYEYTNANGTTVKKDLPVKENNGTIYLNATEPHDNFHIVVSYKDNSGYLIENVSSEVQKLMMIHAPVGFSARTLGDRKASVQLDWSIQYPGAEDLTSTDFFEVQRSLTGKEADFVTIGSVPFVVNPDNLDFTYVDSTLVEAIVEEQLKVNGTLDSLTYRVRRMMTQNWGWDGNNCAASTVCTMNNLHLLSIANYDAQWEDERAYTVRVSWDYADEYGAVWDSRAQMKLRITSTNRAGEVVETQEFALTNKEREARYKIVNLTRPCVNYKIEVFVEKGTSPLMVNTEQFVPIASEEDWNTFAESVRQGKSYNAILMADITVNNTMVGTRAHPFVGIFNGNGHTLDFRYSGSSQSYVSPFAYVGDAVIRNLRVTGKITNGGKFNASIVAHIADKATVFIESCRSSLEINNTLSGDASDGGFVGNAGYANLLTLRNCLFDGKFSGQRCHSCGGFVGWSEGKVNIENCLFSPAAIQTAYDACDTWARMRDRNKLTVVNSYCTTDYTKAHQGFMVINNAADWKAFRDEVEGAHHMREVNAILGADITTDLCIGSSEGTAYNGIFDGNGHTLEFNATSKDEFFAPFHYVYHSTFRNLHVTGNISGGIHTAGLIGTCLAAPNVIIERVQVSANITATGNATDKPHLGGFVGHANNGKFTFEDCVFDGSLTASESNESYGGAILGWGGFATWPPTITMHRAYENGNYNNIAHAGFSYWYDYYKHAPVCWGSDAASTNCISAHNWGEMASANHRNVTDQDALVATMNSEKANSWMVAAGSAAPIMRSTTTATSFTVQELLDAFGWSWQKEGSDKVVPRLVSVNVSPELPTFRHESTGKVNTTLKTEPRQSSVLLTWTTDGNPIDYFVVLRRIKGEKDWTPIAPYVDQMSYEDTSVSPLEDYEYMVRGANDCEGMSYSDTEVKEGSCKHSGKLDGYVRFKDGTGVPGITLEIVSGSVRTTAVTDEKGYFMAEDLSYQKRQSIDYIVTPVSSNAIQLEVGSYIANFNNETNYRQVHEFIVTNSHRFSGYVMYDGTSIPVKGARFRVDGYDMHNAAGGYVETDFDGSFSFHVLDGTRTVQTFLENHTFDGDGYFKGKNGYNFTEDVSQIYFYDNTKVKLTGRIVGGNDQGSLPLDNNLSHNNLGNNLTMVLTLEGDNTSWLVYDNQTPEKSTDTRIFQHPGGGGHLTTVKVERKRMEVKPDSVTGEYVLMLPPVRWKVQQVYCEGYPSLFQDGQVSEVIDLTDCLVENTVSHKGTFTDVDGHSVYQPKESYNYRYNRIYHTPVEITYKQLGYDTFDYFGDKTYTATTVGGYTKEVPLVYVKDNQVKYTFGAPVFSLNRQYPMQVQVGERYLYNNDSRTGKVDLVKIGGGTVTVHNGMKHGMNTTTVELDSLGQGLFILEADQTTRLLTGKDALKIVTLTLEQDSTTYEAQPLKAYTLNMFALGGAKDVLVNGQPQLIDILRDPPGGGSTATLSKGSKLKYTYTLDMSLHAGLNLSIQTGSTLDNFQGAVNTISGSGSVAGIINGTDVEKIIDFEYAFDMEGKRAFSYTMNVNEDITTSSDASMVGADADLYIGMVQNIVVTPMSTIRAIPDSLYQHMLGKLNGGTTAGISNKYGTLVEIAQGQDGAGNLYHLIRDESIGYGPEVSSQFIHSQNHILKQLLPEKVKELRDLMFTGTAAEAQAQANTTGKPVYRSLVGVDDDNFAVLNTKGNDVYYYTSTMPEEQGMNYVIHLPSGTTKQPVDEVAEKCQIIYAWIQMIAENEREKIAAIGSNAPLANYDVDGGTKVNYSEQFESEYTISNYYHLPGIISAPYFDTSGTDIGITLGSIVGVKIVSSILTKIYDKLINSKTTTNGAGTSGGPENGFESRVYWYGKTFKFSLLPVLNYQVKDVSGESKTYSRKESFTVALDKKSHLNFDVYRVETDADVVKNAGLFDVFTGQNFTEMTDYVEGFLKRDNNMQNARYARSFVYHTRGGATCNPWEDQRITKFYSPGRILDERTKKIQNPTISLDRQSISGVGIGDPARFKVYLTNDSEQPEAATGGLAIYTFYLDETSNPHGAKVMVDGIALTSTGWDITLTPGQVTQKTIEVYAGSEFDYEGLRIGVKSRTDWTHIDEQVAFDVHYLRQAGPVNISSPGDKWIMNTDAQYNEKRGWFLPITIDGFDKHQKNFDHIEFQYKESLRGDDNWTNLCSFYADSTLMAQASGVREMIPENGNIRTEFYGEGTVMEKAYDLRAVLYCRNGNTFLTTSSKVMSGVKDTRRPQLFGTPQPVNGILDIGDNIVFNFSEDIEHNYLSAITNFEVKGEVNNQNVTETVSLQFDGNSSVESEAQRNFSGKDLTIDLMVKPDATGKEMPLFSHGINGKKLQLWLTEDYHLKAVVDEQTFVSIDTIRKHGFTQVAMTIKTATDASTKDSLAFYNGGLRIGQFKLNEPYNGTGPLIFGRTNETNRKKSTFYKGRMMEARVWYRALTGGLVGTTYGSRRLTGYEVGLVDYYPMNEGKGDYALDKAQGANAKLYNAAWAMPRGLSLHVDWDDKGIALTENALNRTKEQDYTLMFWFKTDPDGRGVLLSNGAGRCDEINAENHFNIAFEAEKLIYRSNGMACELGNTYSDNKWHHYAMTVNRAYNVANIYVDQALKASFSPDSLGGISGGHPMIGGAKYDQLDSKGHVATIDTRNWLRGNIDEVILFGQALPLTLITAYATKSPGGDEAGLLSYLSFDQQDRQKDNDLTLVPYTYSKKKYLDDNGNPRYVLDPVTKEPTSTLVRDYLFEVTEDVILQHISSETAAPVVPNEELKNLAFSFVGKDNQVLVNINEQTTRLNRRNVYVTLRDVEDKNGNAMASPVTACYYVNNSELRWMNNREEVSFVYGEDNELFLYLVNEGATSHTYTIENCPKWLMLEKYKNVINAQDMEGIRAKVNKNLNVGTYDEILYLTDEDGVSEPYYLNLTITSEQPDWAWSVNSSLLQYSMNVIGRVYLHDEIDIDSRDIVGAFDRDGQCHGFANIDYSAQTGESNLYLTLYDNQKSGRELTFKLWQYSTGRELQLSIDDNIQSKIKFQNAEVLGVDSPVRFFGGNKYVQTFDLKSGWNWVSFNVASEALFDLGNLLDGLPWKENDVLTDMNSNATLVYHDGHWLATNSADDVELTPQGAYAINVQEDIQFPVAGSIIKQEDQRTIKVKPGWNGIGYTPMLNLPLETALSDYFDKAERGDVIKSHTEFAYFTVSGGSGSWRGNLQYMKPGEGYMLLRKSSNITTFTYPFYEPGSTFIDAWASIGTTHSEAPARRSTMSVSAVVEGFIPEENDCLMAFANGEVVGKALLSSAEEDTDIPVVYLSIDGNETGAIWFAIEREGELVATTSEQMTFKANAVVGSPDQPTKIIFVQGDRENGKWYTISGVQLSKRPAQQGVYIFNGKKVVIK